MLFEHFSNLDLCISLYISQISSSPKDGYYSGVSFIAALLQLNLCQKGKVILSIEGLIMLLYCAGFSSLDLASFIID